MRGVIYARYSSDNQREESIEGQIRENTAYAERMESQSQVIISTAHFLQKRMITLNFNV